MVQVRRIRPDDGALLRELRLRSIADAPKAFGQPIEDVRARPEVEWQRAARRASRGDHRTWLFAELDGRVVGLVQGRRRRPASLLLFSMWVEPSARRLGVGRALVETLASWGTGWEARETVLWVYRDNLGARDFYRRLGFRTVHAGPDAETGTRFSALAMRRDGS